MKFLFALLLAPIGAFVAGFDVMLTLFGVSTPLGYARSKWLESRNSITREIIICENCYLSGYVGALCSRCGHRVGDEPELASADVVFDAARPSQPETVGEAGRQPVISASSTEQLPAQERASDERGPVASEVIPIPSLWRYDPCRRHEDYVEGCSTCAEEVLTVRLEKAYKSGYRAGSAALATAAKLAREGALEGAAKLVGKWNFMACSDADGLAADIRGLAAQPERRVLAVEGKT